MTLNDIQTLFNQLINNSKWWSKLKNSEFVNYIVIFVAQIYFRAEQVSSRRLQEAFLSLALKMSSILAHAESRGYVARKRIPTKKNITITNNGISTLQIPADTVLYSQDNDLHFLLRSALVVPAGQIVETQCIQGELKSFSTPVNIEKKFLEKKLDLATSEEIAELEVYITEPAGDRRQWKPTFLFRNTTFDSSAYVEFYTSTQQLGIRFGNGISGKIPPIGSVIDIECVTTQGFCELASGQTLNFINDQLLDSQLTVTTGETLVAGADREDMESLRHNALYHTNYDNNIVFDGDYGFFTKQHIGGLTWFRVWGEKQQEKLKGKSDLDHIAKVYLSAYHPNISQSALMQSLDQLYSNVDTLNITYLPTECRTQPFTVQLDGKVLSTSNPNDVRALIIKALKDSFSDEVRGHNGEITHNNIWKAVESLGLLTRFKLETGEDLDVPVAIDTFRFLDISKSSINISF